MNDPYAELLAQLNLEDGSLKQGAYDLVRQLGPMSCVDVVLVPEGEKHPQVILAYRDATSAMLPNQWWLVGGRVSKGEALEDTAIRKIRKELGLELVITPEDQLLTSRTIQQGDTLLTTLDTINTAYLGRTPPLEEIADKLQPGDGNTKWEVFNSVEDRGLHPYVVKCVNAAWERAYH